MARLDGCRAVGAALAAAALIALAGCGGGGEPGAGAGGDGTSGATQSGGVGTSGARVLVTVSGAIPTTGNAVVSGGTATSSPVVVGGTQRRLVADGAGGGLAHRFALLYDGVSGTVLRVEHGWGASGGAPEAATGCVATPTGGALPACGGAVSVDVVARVARFDGLLLRGTAQGAGGNPFTSILTGTIAFTSP
jgi:hypothetical protein